MSEEKFDSIVEREGDFFLEIHDESFLPLIQVFEHYEVRGLDTEDVAGTLGLEASDVRVAVNYMHENGDVYRELVDRVENFSVDERVFGVAEALRNREDYSLRADRDIYETEAQKSDESESSNTSGDVPDFVEEGLQRLTEKDELTQRDITYRPEEDVIAENVEEAHVEWSRNGSDLGVHIGWNEELSLDTGFVSYTVDGDKGKVLHVDRDEFRDRAEEMYRNAVFGSN